LRGTEVLGLATGVAGIGATMWRGGDWPGNRKSGCGQSRGAGRGAGSGVGTLAKQAS
jgi:hypothetical protein